MYGIYHEWRQSCTAPGSLDPDIMHHASILNQLFFTTSTEDLSNRGCLRLQKEQDRTLQRYGIRAVTYTHSLTLQKPTA